VSRQAKEPTTGWMDISTADDEDDNEKSSESETEYLVVSYNKTSKVE